MITDWMGNEIKEGMEICVINVIDRTPKGGFLIPSKGFYPFEEKPDVPCFEIGKYYKVFGSGDNILYNVEGKMNDGGTYSGVESLAFYLPLPDTQILAIKGISDIEELYLKHKK